MFNTGHDFTIHRGKTGKRKPPSGERTLYSGIHGNPFSRFKEHLPGSRFYSEPCITQNANKIVRYTNNEYTIIQNSKTSLFKKLEKFQKFPNVMKSLIEK